jgi:hypothetical protein
MTLRAVPTPEEQKQEQEAISALSKAVIDSIRRTATEFLAITDPIGDIQRQGKLVSKALDIFAAEIVLYAARIDTQAGRAPDVSHATAWRFGAMSGIICLRLEAELKKLAEEPKK